MAECPHPFEIRLLSPPEFVEGGFSQFGGTLFIGIVYDVLMDTSVPPIGALIKTMVNGIPLGPHNVSWAGARSFAYNINFGPPVTSLTYEWLTIHPSLRSAEGATAFPQGPFDIFFPVPPLP